MIAVTFPTEIVERAEEAQRFLTVSTYRVKVERYGTDAAKAVLRSFDDLCLILAKGNEMAGRNYDDAPMDYNKCVAQTTIQDMIDSLENIVAWYDTHDLIKGGHINSVGDACIEGAAMASSTKDLTSADTIGRVLGVVEPKHCEIVANVTMVWLRDELGADLHMTKPSWMPHYPTEPKEMNPVAVFNDRDGVTKEVVVAMLQSKIEKLRQQQKLDDESKVEALEGSFSWN